MSIKNWFVVYTKPRQESRALENLERQGYATYCPYIFTEKIRRHRWCKIMEPLFPRYLFIQLCVGVDNFSQIRSTFGVMGMVQFGHKPAMLANSTIDYIRDQENDERANSLALSEWKSGDELEIIDGPLKGLKGVFQKKSGTERVSLLMCLLGQQSCISVDSNILMRLD